MNKTKLIMGIVVVAGGLSYLFIAGFQEASATHMTVSQLAKSAEPLKWADRRLQLGGTVLEGTIQWDEYQHRPNFTVTENGAEIAVRYTGNAVVPDTFKDGSPVVLEGFYLPTTGEFQADVIFAKCPSKYEGQSYDSQAAANSPSN